MPAPTPSILTVVDIGTVRLVANLVEKGFKRVVPGVTAEVAGRRVSRRAVHGRGQPRGAGVRSGDAHGARWKSKCPNPGFRLKPGMYARVRLTVERRPNALTVPRSAVVDTEGKRGVFMVDNDQTARFREVQTGLQDGDRIEILDGLSDGERVDHRRARWRCATATACSSSAADRRGGRGGRSGGRGAKAGAKCGRGAGRRCSERTGAQAECSEPDERKYRGVVDVHPSHRD